MGSHTWEAILWKPHWEATLGSNTGKPNGFPGDTCPTNWEAKLLLAHRTKSTCAYLEVYTLPWHSSETYSRQLKSQMERLANSILKTVKVQRARWLNHSGLSVRNGGQVRGSSSKQQSGRKFGRKSGRIYGQKFSWPEIKPENLPDLCLKLSRNSGQKFCKKSGQISGQISGRKFSQPQIWPDFHPEIRPDFWPEIRPNYWPEIRPEIRPDF